MDAGQDLIRQLFAVLLVLCLLGIAVWKLRGGRGLGNPFWDNPSSLGRGDAITVVERTSLTPQHVVHRVRVSGRELLITTHPQGCSLLAELEVDSGTKGACHPGGGA